MKGGFKLKYRQRAFKAAGIDYSVCVRQQPGLLAAVVQKKYPIGAIGGAGIVNHPETGTCGRRVE